jgi:hypothetical protein
MIEDKGAVRSSTPTAPVFSTATSVSGVGNPAFLPGTGPETGVLGV